MTGTNWRPWSFAFGDVQNDCQESHRRPRQHHGTVDDCENGKELYDCCGRGLALKYDDNFKQIENNKDFYYEEDITQKNGSRIENTVRWTLSYPLREYKQNGQ